MTLQTDKTNDKHPAVTTLAGTNVAAHDTTTQRIMSTNNVPAPLRPSTDMFAQIACLNFWRQCLQSQHTMANNGT